MTVLLEESTTASRRRAVWAALWLVVATIFWGAGFTWGKAAQETINRAGPGMLSPIGPILLLAVRFTIVGLIWTALFPRARRGWSGRSFWSAAILGGLLGFGIILQHLGLDRSSEAVTAFLTALSILFVPLISVVVLRRPPAGVLWIGVVIALVGVWRMTGGSPRGFGAGELLGVACAIVFSVHLLALSALVPRDDPFRMTGGQFLVIGAMCWIALPLLPGGATYLQPAEFARVFFQREVLIGFALLALLGTIAFVLMIFFQPRMDPTRAALIYLLEPIWAGIYAWIAAGKAMTAGEIQGAALILAANGMVEWISARRAAREGSPSS